jgi:hypothetical protein
MSDYGFYATNDSGFVQVDSQYDNVAVIAEGSVQASAWTGYAPELGMYWGRDVYPFPQVIATAVTVPATVPDDYLVFAKVNEASSYYENYYSELEGPINRGFCMTHAPSLVRASGYNTTTQLWASDSHRFYFFAPHIAEGSLYQVYPHNYFVVDYKICIRSRDMPNTTSSGMGIKVFKANGEESYSSKNKNFRMTHTVDSRNVKATATSSNQLGSGVGWDLQSVNIGTTEFHETYALMNGKHPCHIQPYYAPGTYGNTYSSTGSSMTWSFGTFFYPGLGLCLSGPLAAMWGPYLNVTSTRTHQVADIYGKFT